MGDHLKKVRSGDPLRIPARTFNTFIDAAKAHLAGRQSVGQAPSRALADAGIVLVQNSSGSDAERFHVLGVSQPIISPAANPDEFKNRVALVGVAPAATHAGKFVVLLEPVPSGRIGPACAAGVCPARVNVQDADDGYADADAGQTVLKSGRQGAALILWKESGTGEKWAVVRLGVAPPCEPLEFGKPKTAFPGGTTIDLDPCDVNGDDNGVADTTVYLAADRSFVASAFSTSDILSFRRFAEADAGGAEGVLVGFPPTWAKQAFAVLVWQDGGTTDGDKASPCNRTYTVKTLDGGTTLGTGMTPKKRRPSAGKLSTPPASGPGVVGLGYYDVTSSFQLYDANETLAVEACT